MSGVTPNLPKQDPQLKTIGSVGKAFGIAGGALGTASLGTATALLQLGHATS